MDIDAYLLWTRTDIDADDTNTDACTCGDNCDCSGSNSGICPVHNPGEVERRIRESDKFWRAVGGR